jgi:hypothetical protein
MEGENVSSIGANPKAEKQTRQRSTIAFPYTDLDSCVAMANAIHDHVGLGDCDDSQLAAWTNQSPKSSGFRIQMYAARGFGLLSGEGGRHKLTELGRAIVDPNQVREAKAKAFLAVPLFKAIFENFKGGVIPPASALEREIVSLGVSEKQKDRARQVLERSAEEAGFFEHGRNRLVMPGVPVREDKPQSEKKDEDGGNDNGGSGGGGGGGRGADLNLDPLLIELLKKIPPAKESWPAAQRVRWFRTFAMNVSQIYDDDATPVELDIKAIKEAAH